MNIDYVAIEKKFNNYNKLYFFAALYKIPPVSMMLAMWYQSQTCSFEAPSLYYFDQRVTAGEEHSRKPIIYIPLIL